MRRKLLLTGLFGLTLVNVQLALDGKAEACTQIEKEIRPASIASAAVIFRGRMVEITAADNGYIRLKFETLETLRGEKRGYWEVYSLDGMFTPPTNIAALKRQFGTDIIAGVQLVEQANGGGGKDAVLVQDVCGPPFFFPVGAEAKVLLAKNGLKLTLGN